MGLFAKWDQAMNNRDVEAVMECVHEDFKFVRHQSGTTMSKRDGRYDARIHGQR